MYRRKSDNAWCQKVKVKDGYRVIYGKTQRELKEKLARLSRSSVSFMQASEEWAKERYPQISPINARLYETTRKRFSPLFDIQMDELRPIDISRVLNNIVQGMSLGTAKRHLSVVHMICQYSVQKGYMDTDPSVSVTLPSGLKRGRRGLPEAEDIETIKNSGNEEFGLFALIALYTGLRKGEVLALTKDDIDLENRIISVTKALQLDTTSVTVKSPKTENGERIVGIPDPLVPYLENLPDGYLFSVNGKPMNETQFQVRWRKYARHTGIKCTPHQLRHEFTSVLVGSGLTPEEVQILVGHANISTTMDIYKHLKQERAQKIAEKARSIF